MYESILVPTDGSEHARRAAEHATALARVFDATVHVLAVVDVQASAGPFSAGGVSNEFVDRLEADASDAIATVESVAEDGGVTDVRTAIVRGKATESILEYAEEHDVELVAMGTHGRTGIEHFVTGSVTEHVVRSTDVPVLTARATEGSRVTGDYDDVLVPTDGSDCAARAFDHGIAIATAFDARVHAVTVVDATDVVAGSESTVPSGIVDELEGDGEAATAAVADRAREADLDVVTAVREGTPARSLLDYADERGVDLITMGTAGRTGPNRFLVGSTTERIVRHGEVPVLAVNARGRTD